MSVTKFIISETASFTAKLFHHKERAKSSPDNPPNFTNPLTSNIEAGDDTFTFKEATSQSEELEFVEEMRKEIGSH